MQATPNSVALIRYWGDDKAIAQSAWISTGGESPEKLARIPSLLQMLADNHHGSPFEHVGFTFQVTSEIASQIHAIKHRAGVSINSASARYRELNDDRYYVPADWPEDIAADYRAAMEVAIANYHALVERLQKAGLSRSRAKESARFIRPYGCQLDWQVTFNLRSFAHFVGLRASPHAQAEIREIAQRMVQLVMDIPGNPFEHSIASMISVSRE